MTNNYNAKQNGVLNYDLAIDALRESGIRSGKITPRTPRERMQLEQGPVCTSQLDVVKVYRSGS